MDPAIILVAIVVIPVVLLTLLRINAVLVFLSLCLGNVLVQFVSGDAGSLTNLFNSQTNQSLSVNEASMKLILLLFPAALTSLFMIHTVKGTFRLLLNLVPAVGVGLLIALLGVPLLSSGLSHTITSSSLWEQGQKAQTLIVGITALTSLLVLWLQRPKTGHFKHHRRKHQ